MLIWPNHDYYDSETPHLVAYTIFKPGVTETLFMGHSKGPTLEAFTKDGRLIYWEIETDTHALRIYASGKLMVKMRGWPDFYPVDDSIFGVKTDELPLSKKGDKLPFFWTKEEFKKWRVENKLTQEELGYLIGVHSITISKMERGILSCPDIKFGLERLLRRAEMAKKIFERANPSQGEKED